MSSDQKSLRNIPSKSRAITGVLDDSLLWKVKMLQGMGAQKK